MHAIVKPYAVLPLLAALALSAPCATARADDAKPGAPAAPAMKKIDNPEFTSWSGFKVGAFVEMTMETSSMGQASTVKTTHKLVELTADKAVVETTMVTNAGGQEFAMPAQKRDVPKQIEVPDVKPTESPDPKAPKVVEGEESIDVGGQKVACKTTETTMEMQA